jgi:hypothetical protein
MLHMKPAHPAGGRPLPRRGATRGIPETPASEREDDAPLLDLPDGWYWVAPDGHQQFGPFDTAEMARADRARGSVESADDESAVRDMERVAGIAESADVETENSDEDRPSSAP